MYLLKDQKTGAGSVGSAGWWLRGCALLFDRCIQPGPNGTQSFAPMEGQGPQPRSAIAATTVSSWKLEKTFLGGRLGRSEGASSIQAVELWARLQSLQTALPSRWYVLRLAATAHSSSYSRIHKSSI